MKLLHEIKALNVMRQKSDNTGEIIPFIHATGDCLFIDIYELLIAYRGASVLKKQFRWEYNPDTVDIWEDLKFRIPFSDRQTFQNAFSTLRYILNRLIRDGVEFGFIESCRRWADKDIRFLFILSPRRMGWAGPFQGRQLVWRNTWLSK